MLDTKDNVRPATQDIVTTLVDLISESQGSKVVHSEPDYTLGAPSHECWSLDEAINFPSVHYPLLEK